MVQGLLGIYFDWLDGIVDNKVLKVRQWCDFRSSLKLIYECFQLHAYAKFISFAWLLGFKVSLVSFRKFIT